MNKDIDLPASHPMYKVIVFDGVEDKYYNKRSDMYLTEHDVKFHNLPAKEELPGYKMNNHG